MPVQGLVRLRKHQFARQSAAGTPAVAAGVAPFMGVPEVELNWTDPELNVGSLDPVVAPSRQAPDLTAPLTDPQVNYNTLPLLHAAFFGGGVTPTSGATTARTWVFSPASVTVDEFDYFTYEFGDDVLTDWYQLTDGVLESFELTGPEGLVAVEGSMTWRFGGVASTGSTDSPVTGTVPTPGLSVEANPALLYSKDLAISIADTVAGLGAGQINDALYSWVLRFSGDIDEKRYANGDQSFDVDAMVRATRLIELEATYAKTSQTVGTGSESDDWISDQAVDRYIKMVFTSTSMAEGVVPYSWTFTMPARYYTRPQGEVGGNTVIVLTAHAFYDPDDLDGVFESTIVNTFTSTRLGATPALLMARSAEAPAESKTAAKKTTSKEPVGAGA